MDIFVYRDQLVASSDDRSGVTVVPFRHQWSTQVTAHNMHECTHVATRAQFMHTQVGGSAGGVFFYSSCLLSSPSDTKSSFCLVISHLWGEYTELIHKLPQYTHIYTPAGNKHALAWLSISKSISDRGMHCSKY